MRGQGHGGRPMGGHGHRVFYRPFWGPMWGPRPFFGPFGGSGCLFLLLPLLFLGLTVFRPLFGH
jgi:hypothetical protein